MIDAIVLGSGPNGLAAAVTLARAGLDVQLVEANTTLGGGARTVEVDGAQHDWGSAVHPMALASPFFRSFGLNERIDLAIPDLSYAHPLDGGRAALAWRDLERTASGLGADGPAWRRLFRPLAGRSSLLAETVLTPLFPLPRHPFTAVGFAASALASRTALRTVEARSLLAGVVAHTISPPALAASGAGMVLAALAHSGGWPIPIGGSQAITDALLADFTAHRGRVVTGFPVRDLSDLPAAHAYLFDTSASGLVAIAGDALEAGYRRALGRARAGEAASKVDFVLNAPVPWMDERVGAAGTLHLGGTAAEIAAGERELARGLHPLSPYVLVSQPSLFDESRAPAGRHTLWTYTHVPRGSDRDMTAAVTAQIERFAPGFRDTVVSARATTAAAISTGNRSMAGGDIANGAITLRQLLVRPVLSRSPWRAGSGLYLCSAAAVPGPGVHGMGGYQAAVLALREVFALPAPSLAP